MKKYIAIFMSILVMMVSIFIVPAEVVAEEDIFLEIPCNVSAARQSISGWTNGAGTLNIYIHSNGDVDFLLDCKFDEAIKPYGNIQLSSYIDVNGEKFNLFSYGESDRNEKNIDCYELIVGTHHKILPYDSYVVKNGIYFRGDNISHNRKVTVTFENYTITREIGNGDFPQIITQDSVFGDIDGDGLINANDASLILSYSTYCGVGGSLSFKEWLAQ